MKQNRIKLIRRDLTSRRHGTLKQLIFLFFFLPGKLLKCATSILGVLAAVFWAGLFRDLDRKGRTQISVSHQQDAEFDILLLTVVTDQKSGSHRIAEFYTITLA